MPSEPWYVYLDTNTFLHYKRFTEIQWVEELGYSPLVLVVPAAVITELDRHKHSPTSKKMRERAQKALSLLDEKSQPAVAIQLREDVCILLQVDEPAIDWDEQRLSRDSGDDQVIATVLSDGYPRDQVRIVSGEYGLKLKAQAKNITCHRLTDRWRLPQEETPEEKEVRELRAWKQRYDRAAPKLSLRVEGDDGSGESGEFHLSRPQLLSPKDIDGRIAELRQSMEYQPPITTDRPVMPVVAVGLAASLGLAPSEGEVERYQHELEEYLERYRRFLEERNEHLALLSWALHLRFVLANDGSAPADDIHVSMHFPDGFELSTDADFPGEPTEPPRPELPRIWAEIHAESTDLTRILPRLSALMPSVPRYPPSDGPRGPHIEKTGSYEVTYEIPRLMHCMQCDLAPLYAVFEFIEAAEWFHVKYSIIAENTPSPSQGQLHILVHRDDA